MRLFLLPIILGLAHGLADTAASFLLWSLPGSLSAYEISLLILLYNLLAFGYQPFAGMLTDKFQCSRAATLIGLILLGSAIAMTTTHPKLAIILAGIGSAAFHVGGGAIALWATPKSTLGAGFFTAPGAIGLALGTVLGLGQYNVTGLILSLFLAIALTIAVIPIPKIPNYPPSPVNFPTRAGIIIIISSAIALTAIVWTSLDFLWRRNLPVLMAIAVAAAIGKIAGGIFADQQNLQFWTVGALALSTILLAAGGQNLITLLPAVALLQSSTPITLVATAQLFPNQPATATGLALGLAVAIGGIPVVGGFGESTGNLPISAFLVLATMLLLWWGLKQPATR